MTYSPLILLKRNKSIRFRAGLALAFYLLIVLYSSAGITSLAMVIALHGYHTLAAVFFSLSAGILIFWPFQPLGVLLSLFFRRKPANEPALQADHSGKPSRVVE